MGIRYRPTMLLINADNIAYNTRTLKNYAGDSSLMAIVKADALGHGAIEASKIVLRSGATWLGVATIEEGIELRDAGIIAPILILGPIFPEQIISCMQYNFDFIISSDCFIKKLKETSIIFEKEVYAHLKIDTGMHRAGISPSNLHSVLKEAKEINNLFLRGICTHFYDSPSKNKKTSEDQVMLFNKCVNEAEGILGFTIPIKHMANSSGIINHKSSHFNMVRSGIGLYGYYDDIELSKLVQLKPAATWLTKVTSVRCVPKDSSIGYGGTYITIRKTIIATIPVGYADGFNRLLSNRGQVLVKGKKVDIIGRISMDQTMIDVTDIENVVEGDEVILIGKQLSQEISIYEMADLINTIPNDILVSIKSRVPRVYY